MINLFKDDAIQLWLRKTIWSKKELAWSSEPKRLLQEQAVLHSVLMQPASYIKGTYRQETVNYTVFDGDHVQVTDTIDVLDGYRVQIKLPARLDEQLLNVKIAPVNSGLSSDTALDNSALIHEFARGCWIETESFADKNVPKEKSDRDAEAGSPAIFPDDGHRIWQFWVPVQKGVDSLEIQLNYPANVFDLSEQEIKDHGVGHYRMKVPLAPSGYQVQPVIHSGQMAIDNVEANGLILPVSAGGNE